MTERTVTERTVAGRTVTGRSSAGPSDGGVELPLTGVRVVDLCRGGAALAARVLGDLGADVVRIEPPGTPGRAPGTDVRHETHNFNKRALALGLESAAGRERLLGLLATSDIVIEGLDGPLPGRLGLGEGEFRRRFPALVVVSVTEFGRSGPYRDWAGTDAVHAALAGFLSRSGLPGRPPLLPPAALPTGSAALVAAWSALLAHHNRLVTGIGDDVEVSIFESTVQVIDPGYGMAGSATSGIPTSDGPRGRPDAGHLYPVFRCADGYVRLCILKPRQWRAVFEWMGRPARFADPALADMSRRFAVADVLHPEIGRLLAHRKRDEAAAELQRLGIPAAAVLDLPGVLRADHFAARGVFTGVPTPEGEMSVPDCLFGIDGHRVGLRTPAPQAGESAGDPAGPDAAGGTALPVPLALPVSPAPPVSAGPRRPLDGLRVLDLGVIVVGGESGRLLADMGAEVIKIESAAFPDGSRQSLTVEPISPVFAWGNRNKASLGLDLRDPRGRALFLELARSSDVVLSNFKPGTMEKLGLGAAELHRVNPRLVVADSSAFGADGPWGDWLGYGPLVRAATGISLLWRDDIPDARGGSGGGPGGSGGDAGGFADASTIYPDHVAARVAAIGVLALLVRRRRTGRGGTVSVAQAEVILGQNPDLYAAASLGRADGARRHAPRGVYPCAGDDEWVVVDARDSADWRRLAAVIGGPSLAADPRFATTRDRRDHAAEIDGLIAAWTSQRPPRAAASALQAVGVPAGMMLRLTELPDDEHLRARGAFRVARHPLIPRPMPSENTPARFRNIPDVELRPAPMPGEQTRRVARELLGLDEDEIQRLVDDGVLQETTPSDY
ncbi:CaiB/BaiF CoA transferase family protein [Parafrankia discariae]|uniref:CaiB/BaiF CoA transferase family protein n=1 Tax=Parafrankia discariae TaxID=365528 RepID=UPI0003A209CB|nr:CoA transferase [Parafrankia discariae]